MFVELTFELISLSARWIEADIWIDSKMPLQVTLQIVFVHELCIAHIAEILARSVADARAGIEHHQLVAGIVAAVAQSWADIIVICSVAVVVEFICTNVVMKVGKLVAKIAFFLLLILADRLNFDLILYRFRKYNGRDAPRRCLLVQRVRPVRPVDRRSYAALIDIIL